MSQGKSDINVTLAERLQTEGNELFRRGEYLAAVQKLTEALNNNPADTGLHANCAEISRAISEYLDVSWDDEESAELKAAYARARTRRAAASHGSSACIELQQGIECLSDLDKLTPVERERKRDFQEELKEAYAATLRVRANQFIISEELLSSGTLPWDVAAKAVDGKTIAEKPSCVFLIHSAYEELHKAVLAIEMPRTDKNAQGEEVRIVPFNIFHYFSNSILIDRRVFGMRNWDIFAARIRMQSDLENRLFGGWVECGEAATIKKEAPERLKAKGWTSVAAALDFTIRTWVFTAWARQQMGHFDLSRRMLMNALDVLEWGRKQWPDIPTKDRGVVFERRFIRPVKVILLEIMRESVFRDGPTEITYDELIQFAEDIVNDAGSDTDTPPSKTSFDSLAYWFYPKGTALSVLGWTYLRKVTQASPGDLQRTPNLRKAFRYYLSAATNFLEDDESHVQFLGKALECMCSMGSIPLKQTLDLCKKIRESFYKAIEIWGAPPYGDTLRTLFARVKEFEDKYRQLILEGKCTLDAISGRFPEARG